MANTRHWHAVYAVAVVQQASAQCANCAWRAAKRISRTVCARTQRRERVQLNKPERDNINATEGSGQNGVRQTVNGNNVQRYGEWVRNQRSDRPRVTTQTL